MTHRQKLEQILDLLINEETDAASDLLHTVIVEKARTMYEDLVEDFGGDEKEDFASEIEADKDEIESDEIYDDEEGEEGEEEYGEEGEESDEPADEEEIEDRVEDLEAQLGELRAEFEQIIDGDELEGGLEGDLEGGEEFGDEVVGDEEGFGDVELGGEDEYTEEGMYEEIIDELDEATKLQDEVSGNPLDSEGKLTGTGKNSKTGATGKVSPFTKAPRKAEHGGKPHQTKGGDESTKKVGEGEDNTPTSNIDVKTGEKKSADNNPKDDKGAKSPLGSKGSPTGV